MAISSPELILKLIPFKELNFDPLYFIVKSFASRNPFTFFVKNFAFAPSTILGLF